MWGGARLKLDIALSPCPWSRSASGDKVESEFFDTARLAGAESTLDASGAAGQKNLSRKEQTDMAREWCPLH
jgi:hypothetical protein